VHALAGPPIPGLGPLFSIFDENRREIVLLGPDRDDLVFRYRTRATDLRLDQPDLRFRGAMAEVAPGDTMAVRVEGARSGYCIALNALRRCQLGFTLGRGWGMLLYPERFPVWLMGPLDLLWLSSLALLVGFWARRRWETTAAVLLMVAAAVAVPRTTVLVPSPTDLMGIAGGLGVGILLKTFIRRSIQNSGVPS
jgi:hypothetical protein